MLALLAAVALFAGVIAGGGQVTSATPRIALTITVWPNERVQTEFKKWTLRCNPLGGTLPGRRVACRRLARLGPAAFAPVPRDAVCTQVYGGPQLALVRGVFGQRRIWTTFRRRNGCEIDRWQRLSPWLLPPGGVGA